MRRAFQALMLCGAASMATALPAAARDYPFWIKGCDHGGGHGDCSFSSYQQCQASLRTASVLRCESLFHRQGRTAG
jgi:Protein of unknown function (DUF3551)